MSGEPHNDLSRYYLKITLKKILECPKKKVTKYCREGGGRG
jgi:hypothetical protein